MAELPYVAGRELWIACWYGILAIGIVGLIGSLSWGVRHGGKHLDEILRGIGTILVSTGMLLVLYGGDALTGQVLLTAAVGVFGMAFAVADRRRRRNRPPLRLDAASAGRPVHRRSLLLLGDRRTVRPRAR